MTGRHRATRRRHYSPRIRDAMAAERRRRAEPAVEVLVSCRDCGRAVVTRTAPDAQAFTVVEFGVTDDDRAYCSDCLDLEPQPTAFVSLVQPSPASA